MASKEPRNQTCLIDLVKVIVMKGLASAMFWSNHSVYTSNFAYPTSFGYK